MDRRIADSRGQIPAENSATEITGLQISIPESAINLRMVVQSPDMIFRGACFSLL